MKEDIFPRLNGSVLTAPNIIVNTPGTVNQEKSLSTKGIYCQATSQV